MNGLDRFIETHAIRLPNDVADADPSLLAGLDARLAGHDVVALGEMNHFIHEKTDFRLLFARHLVARGWTDFYEEIGWSDGVRIDRYLQSGDEAALRLPCFDDLAHLRADRDDRPGGILTSDSYPVEAFVAEQKRFYRGLRAASQGRARLAGIDIDALPGGAYDDIAATIPANDPRAEAFRQALARAPGESAPQEAARLRALDIPSGWPPQIATARDMLAESLDYIAMTYGAQTYDAVRPGLAFREEAMKRRFDVAERAFGGGRTVLLGHAHHLIRDDALIHSGGVGPGAGKVSSLGQWLAHERGKRIFTIWMIYGAGEDCQPLPSLPRRAAFPRDTLNAQLARFGMPLLFFPPDAPELFERPARIGHLYNAVFETPLAAAAGAVLFVPTVTPLRV